MFKSLIYKGLFIVVVVNLFISCTKEGTGGKAKIEGIVYEELIDYNGKFVESRVSQNKKVYITYGSNELANEDVESSVLGKYEFKYLTKGDYTVICYSDCDTCDGIDNIIEHKISIDSRTDVVEQDITVVKIVDPEDGTSTLKGRLMIQKYLGTTPSGVPYPAQNKDVFIVYDEDEVHFEKTDSDPNGMFEFRNLIKGKYTVFAYSICDTCAVVYETKEAVGKIILNSSIVDIGDIVVETP